MRRTLDRGVVSLATVALAGLGGCSGAGTAAADASATSNAGAATGPAIGGSAASPAARQYQRRVLPIGREFARCARRNGRPNFPDPHFDQNGYLQFADSGGKVVVEDIHTVVAVAVGMAVIPLLGPLWMSASPQARHCFR